MEELLRDVTERLSIFPDIYTYIRVIDPDTMEAYMVFEKTIELGHTCANCFDFWKAGKRCSTCVSMKAIATGKTSVKIEMRDGKCFLVHGFSTTWKGKVYVIEMIKDMSDQELLLTEELGHTSDLPAYLSDLNSKIYEDRLTGIFNRRYIDDRLPEDIKRLTDMERTHALFITDIDRFKFINDTYGHLAGDAILKQLAALYREQISAYDGWVARYGGDEYMIFLTNLSREQVLQIGEDFRRTIENFCFKFEQMEFYITCSYGICFNGIGEWGFFDLMDKADKSLYEAKKNGKNQVILFTE